jgi:hypothetical protein
MPASKTKSLRDIIEVMLHFEKIFLDVGCSGSLQCPNKSGGHVIFWFATNRSKGKKAIKVFMQTLNQKYHICALEVFAHP